MLGSETLDSLNLLKNAISNITIITTAVNTFSICLSYILLR